MQNNNSIASKILGGNLILQIVAGILIGGLLAAIAPDIAESMKIFGDLFTKALKAIAPILVFVLIISAIANQRTDKKANMRPVITLYLIGTFSAALIAVILSFAFPSTLILDVTQAESSAPQGIGEVINTLLFNLVDNPINALSNANYIGILAWGIAIGAVLRHANATTKLVLHDVSNGITNIVRFIIRLAPIGIFGLVSSTFAAVGFEAIASYTHLVLVLLSAMGIMALVVNPLLVFYKTKQNPYPLVFRCLRESGVTAFFTRSSAANIPVNMNLCKKLDLDEDTYSVSIPLGATINMAGAAITITILTLAAAHTTGVVVDMPTALLLSVLAAVSACGASGVAGGSLLLIPLACSLFGIDNDIAMKVVAVGFIISVIQDSAETALNSSTDVLFTAAVCRSEAAKK